MLSGNKNGGACEGDACDLAVRTAMKRTINVQDYLLSPLSLPA
jgi:hypothetical protein